MELPFKVMDADGHIAEDTSHIRDYMEAPYNENLWQGIPDKQGRVGHASSLSGQSFVDTTMGGTKGSVGPAGYPFPNDWLEALEWGNMDTTVLFPYQPPRLWRHLRPRLHDSLVSRLQLLPRRRVAFRKPQAQGRLPDAIAGRRCVDQGDETHNHRARILRRDRTRPWFRGPGSPECTTPSTKRPRASGASSPSTAAPQSTCAFNKFIQKHTASFPMSNMLQLVHMTYEGVFEKVPQSPDRLPGNGMHLGPILHEPHGRRVGEARPSRSHGLQESPQRIHQVRQRLLPR